MLKNFLRCNWFSSSVGKVLCRGTAFCRANGQSARWMAFGHQPFAWSPGDPLGPSWQCHSENGHSCHSCWCFVGCLHNGKWKHCWQTCHCLHDTAWSLCCVMPQIFRMQLLPALFLQTRGTHESGESIGARCGWQRWWWPCGFGALIDLLIEWQSQLWCWSVSWWRHTHWRMSWL